MVTLSEPTRAYGCVILTWCIKARRMTHSSLECEAMACPLLAAWLPAFETHIPITHVSTDLVREDHAQAWVLDANA